MRLTEIVVERRVCRRTYSVIFGYIGVIYLFPTDFIHCLGKRFRIGISSELIERKTKTGKIFYGCEKYPDCDFTTWDKPLNEACGKCGGMLVEHVERNGRKQKFCSNPECADARPVRPSAAKTTTATTTTKTAAKKTKTTTRKTAAKKTTTKAAATKKGTKA